MNVPQSQNLHSQSFHSNVIEFVWVFSDPKGGIQQFIFGYTKNQGFYMETGKIDALGNYIETPNWAQGLGLHQLMDNDIWGLKETPTTYNNFSNGKDLIDLAHDCLFYIKNV